MSETSAPALCRRCDAPLHAGDAFCRACGAYLSVGPLGLDWVWVIYGTVIITTLQYAVLAAAGMSFLGEELAAALTNTGGARVGLVVAKAIIITASGYLFGGVLVGRMSSGHTIVEPALAAALPAATLLGYLLVRAYEELTASGIFWTVGLVALGAVLACFLVALLGGYLGERWQDWAIARRKAKRRV
jgi:hypothetical protein